MSGRGGALRGDQPARIGAVVRFMRQCGLPWKEIAADLAVSERQARRWLEACAPVSAIGAAPGEPSFEEVTS